MGKRAVHPVTSLTALLPARAVIHALSYARPITMGVDLGRGASPARSVAVIVVQDGRLEKNVRAEGAALPVRSPIVRPSFNPPHALATLQQDGTPPHLDRGMIRTDVSAFGRSPTVAVLLV